MVLVSDLNETEVIEKEKSIIESIRTGLSEVSGFEPVRFWEWYSGMGNVFIHTGYALVDIEKLEKHAGRKGAGEKGIFYYGRSSPEDFVLPSEYVAISKRLKVALRHPLRTNRRIVNTFFLGNEEIGITPLGYRDAILVDCIGEKQELGLVLGPYKSEVDVIGIYKNSLEVRRVCKKVAECAEHPVKVVNK